MGNQLASVIQLKEKISTQQRRFSFEFVSSGFGVAREKKTTHFISRGYMRVLWSI